jgi:hypothetical protein
LKRTVRGDRGFAYESDDGITALVDCQGPTFRTENFGYAAPCIFRPLCRPVPRSDLSRLTSLNTLFGKPGVPRSTQNLTVSQAEAIASLIGDPLPPVILIPEVNFTDERLIWNRASQVWGLEGPMRDRVLNSEAWRALFRQKPRAEVRRGTENRYDLLVSRTELWLSQASGHQCDPRPARPVSQRTQARPWWRLAGPHCLGKLLHAQSGRGRQEAFGRHSLASRPYE